MPNPGSIPFREADANGHYKSKELPQDKDDFLIAIGLPTFAGDVTTGSGGGTAGGEVATFFSTSGHVIKAATQTGLAKLNAGVLSSVPAPVGDVVGTTDVQTLTNKTLNSPQINTPTGLTKYDVGLGNVDNTSDATKPPPASVTAALATKEDKTNKGVTNGYASLDTIGKIPLSQIPDAVIGTSRYQGTWNAATNSPAIPAAAPGNSGYYYSVAVAGTTNINGINTWAIGDQIISNGSVWQKIPVANAVQSVNGKQGIVTIDKNDVGLGNVDNTSDATKNSASATLTNKTIDGANNTLTVRLNTTDVIGNLPVNKLDGGTAAGATTFWRGDGHWVTPTGAGDVQGPGSSVDGDLAVFNGTTGKQLRVGQVQAQNAAAGMISGQVEKTTLVDPDDMFLEVDKVSGALRYVRAKWFSTLPRGSIYGIGMANNGADTVNDVDIGSGQCSDSTGTVDIRLASVLTKRLDANWVAGTNQGGRDTGSIVDQWWHVFAIKNPTTGVSDALFSLSATAPTLPSGYTAFRRVGSVFRTGGVIQTFLQLGDYFGYAANQTYSGTSARAMSLFQSAWWPPGIVTFPILKPQVTVSSGVGYFIFGSGYNSGIGMSAIPQQGLTNATNSAVVCNVNTNLNREINVQFSISGTASEAYIHTNGYYDNRGKDGYSA